MRMYSKDNCSTTTQRRITPIVSKQPVSLNDSCDSTHLPIIQHLKDTIFPEALRKYPPLPFLDRTCTADYRLPGSNVIIEKGVPVYIPLFGLQNDEKYFSEPDKYIPERHQSNVNADHLVFASFGYGPRNCIGEYPTTYNDTSVFLISNEQFKYTFQKY